MIRADYPGNIKRGGVWICFKEPLPSRILDVAKSLDECLICELRYKNKACFIATLYPSPSQSREELEKLLSNFEVLIKAISNQKDRISIIMGDLLWGRGWGVNMTYLTMKEYKLTPSLQRMVFNNWDVDQPTSFLILRHVVTWLLQTNQTCVWQWYSSLSIVKLSPLNYSL